MTTLSRVGYWPGMRRLTLPLLSLVCLCGCGTVSNIQGTNYPMMEEPGQYPTTPFGGVERDVRHMKETRAWSPLAVVFHLTDMPFSFAGDVVTLPYTIYRSATPPPSRPEPASQ